MSSRVSIRDILVTVAAAAAPLAFTTSTGCDLYDVVEHEVAIRDYIDDEQVQTLCGMEDPSHCAALCGHIMTRIQSFGAPSPCEGECQPTWCEPHTAVTVTMVCECSYIAGRRPEGLTTEGHACGGDGVGQWLAWAAHMEAAAVHAFASLAAELEQLGAPAALVERARAAARDEVVHVAMVGRLAVERGAHLVTPQVEPTPPRSRVELAMENAAEGCVRETFAALVAMVQARQARLPEVREVFGRVARDESRHGELAWDIHAWLWPQLSAEEQARVLAARDAAYRSLTTDELPVEVRTPLGLPSPAQGRRMVEGFGELLS